MNPIQEIKRFDDSTLLAACGRKIHKKGITGPCPQCGETIRSKSRNDKRPAILWKGEGRGWKCIKCQAFGKSTFDLLFWHFTGQATASGVDNIICHKFYEEMRTQGLLSQKDEPPKKIKPPALSTSSANRSRAPRYPPEEHIARLWNFALPIHKAVQQNPEILRYLNEKEGIGNLLKRLPLEALRACRWVHPSQEQETWGKLLYKQYRITTPLYDATGFQRSVTFRPTKIREGWAKSLCPKGFSTSGLIRLNDIARKALVRPSLAMTPTRKWNRELVFVEGDTDFWAYDMLSYEKEYTPAIIGIHEGGWSDEWAQVMARNLKGVIIRFLNEQDNSGKRMAIYVARSLIKAGVSRKQMRMK
jgi:predicted RNA-binding Zn-ribbon protein involved in translation (DUF1610 family)